MLVGFTGTRDGLSGFQASALGALLENDCRPKVFHHGACVGADSNAAEIVRHLDPSILVVAHPGKSAKGGENALLDEYCLRFAHEVRETKTHFARNRDIVNETDVLIATPSHNDVIAPDSPGGTAYTVNYARKLKRPIYIVRPSGEVQAERVSLKDFC